MQVQWPGGAVEDGMTGLSGPEQGQATADLIGLYLPCNRAINSHRAPRPADAHARWRPPSLPEVGRKAHGFSVHLIDVALK